ncbi:hypothetical protein B0T16DRAFT_456651 [Cercophora newfieldiana]|uniref:DUF6594 domain-containing protein n=1 Tax=Cercophora newfieldiana TaxID=92897 RepID=A0AA40CRZ7_9PEZI|nr:hypothetical protein B0T16DRAFT_456651 [Cercophora newfieldiana]
MANPLIPAVPPPSPQSHSKPDVEASIPITDPISKAVVDTGRRHTFYTNERGVRFNLVALHRMNMHYLRKRLIDEAAIIFKNGAMDDDNSRALTGLMRDYCTAVRDRDCMRDLAYRDWQNNPFHLKSEREMERGLFEYLRAQGVEPESEMATDDRVTSTLPGGPWDYPSSQRNRKERYALTILGSVIIIVPMVIMAFVPGRIPSVVIVVACTMLFAVGTAYFSPTKPPLELMIATAAYAAVLVVFVGASITDMIPEQKERQ